MNKFFNPSTVLSSVISLMVGAALNEGWNGLIVDPRITALEMKISKISTDLEIIKSERLAAYQPGGLVDRLIQVEKSVRLMERQRPAR